MTMESALLTEIRLGIAMGGRPKVIIANLAKSGRHPASDLLIGLLQSNHPEVIVKELVAAHDQALQEEKCSLLMI
ncbi:hypothetical protein D3C75_1284520 [compost metagenome]